MSINDPDRLRSESTLDRTAVIGAGIVGSVIAWALAREGRKVLLLDRSDPGLAGASFGNAGHIATEQIQPLPSPGLLWTFWRELFAFGGPLDIPLRRWLPLAPWILRFVGAAFRQQRNTPALASLVRPAAQILDACLGEIGRRDLLCRRGHYTVWLGPGSSAQAARAMHDARALGVCANPAPQRLLEAAAARAGAAAAAGCHYPDSAHVVDPCRLAGAFVQAAVTAGATYVKTEVREIFPLGSRIGVRTAEGVRSVPAAVVCAGVESAPLLSRFGLKAPLTAERGYHIELPGETPLEGAPVVYGDHSIVVTPMDGRLRATSYLELERHGAPADPRKLQRLHERVRQLGYRGEHAQGGWVGSRPTLPDYLPGLGRAAGEADLFYAVGHQHLGLTLAAPSAEVIAALVAHREPEVDVRPFDLRRFGVVR
jgi:glycine/D-amino acid oxidase-like deaminating enzyme